MKIIYDGAYPNLCSGHLTVYVNDIAYEFGRCLESGGCAYFADDEDYVRHGEWTINSWPDNFPVELRDELLELVNDEIRLGCCGGCL